MVTSNNPVPPLAPSLGQTGAVPPLAPAVVSLVRIGTVTLKSIEVPQNLPATVMKALSVHDFPGGIRTAQRHGSFTGDLVFSGILFGEDARSREQELKQLVTQDGDPIIFSFDQWKFNGHLKEFTADIQNQWHIPYRAVFLPLEDLSAGAVAPASPLPPSAQLSQGMQQFSEKLNSPSGGYSFSAPLVQQGNGLLDTINDALKTAGGNPGTITKGDATIISQQIENLDQALTPLSQSSDVDASLSATEVRRALRVLGRKATGQLQTLTIITVNNPNLVTLASTYYQDPSLWIYIAEANNLLDFQLSGSYTLTIPVAPSTVPPKVTNYMNRRYAG